MSIRSHRGHECRNHHGGIHGRVTTQGWSHIVAFSIPMALCLALTMVLCAGLAHANDSQPAGWSTFVPSGDSRIIFVSSSQGNDNNSGLTPDEPLKTIQAGYQKLRNGYPDWLLLRRGDAWHNEGFSGSNVWSKSGRSDAEPMRLASYGSETKRPRITSSGDGFVCHHNRNNVAVTGIHLQSSNGGNDGVRLIMAYGKNWLFEDCKIEGFQNNMNLQGFGSPGEVHNLRIRRSVIVDAASTGGGHSQGIFAHNIHGLLVEECVIDRNGWSQNSNPNGAGYPTVFNHNMYITTYTKDAAVRGNLVCDGSSHGVQLRCGGEIIGNVFARNPLAILLGGGDPNPDTHTYGVSGIVRNNLVIEGRDINTNTPRGFGIDISNIASATVIDNIVANHLGANQPRPFTLHGSGYGSGVGVQNTVIRDNIIYNWTGSVLFQGSNIHNISLHDNDIQVPNGDWLVDHHDSATVATVNAGGNRWHSHASAHQWFLINGNFHSLSNWMSMAGDTSSSAVEVSYPNPMRSLGSYNATLGGTNSHGAFMSEARTQSRANWREELTAAEIRAYFREGFGVE